ncbi:MAG: class I SAM-dependent methyltransferase [Nanoarchaeota archaeon]|nr:class I SAM-dependent methyltransferase [Nanoarchaeota archaeon]
MVENRYSGKLVRDNQYILGLSPANKILRLELALEYLENCCKISRSFGLEIGVGEGDLTKEVLKYNPNINVSVLDVSPEMIESAKNNLKKYEARINYVQSDVLDFLAIGDDMYPNIFSSWTIHNFDWPSKIKTFHRIYGSLCSKGGKMFLMDKIYPDDKSEGMKLLDRQILRYQNYLDEPGKIIIHEMSDYSDAFRMDESKTINILKKIGFRDVEIRDRVERDVLLVATK